MWVLIKEFCIKTLAVGASLRKALIREFYEKENQTHFEVILNTLPNGTFVSFTII